jgi:deoxycytidylate deaminase
MQSDQSIIGLTGSFGSGCSTLCCAIKELAQNSDLKVRDRKISEEIREEAGKGGKSNPDRPTMQDIGNEFREKHSSGYWAKRVLSKIATDGANLLIVDGIRNLGEVEELRKYRLFFLIAVDCSTENRWERLKDDVYKGNKGAFENDDRRDKDEGLPHGQQVLRCVEEADIVFINEEQFPTKPKIQDEIKSRFEDHFLLIIGKRPRMPNLHETMMAVASNLALQSRCVKRRVGAVLCSKSGFIVSAAYNAVPYPGKSCHDEFRMCYRELYRNTLKKKLVASFDHCPKCRYKLEAQQTADDLNCPGCKTNLGDLLPPIKALDKCKSLHAEEVVALRTAEFQVNGSTLYTTTFPCLQCAKRLCHVGIKSIFYIDPYPEEEAIKLLEEAGVKTIKFSGVKAQAFYRFFYPYRGWIERQIQERSGKES